jgi:hypothetical protein
MARDDPRPPHAERFAHLRKGTRHSAPGSSRAPTPWSPGYLVRRIPCRGRNLLDSGLVLVHCIWRAGESPPSGWSPLRYGVSHKSVHRPSFDRERMDARRALVACMVSTAAPAIPDTFLRTPFFPLELGRRLRPFVPFSSHAIGDRCCTQDPRAQALARLIAISRSHATAGDLHCVGAHWIVPEGAFGRRRLVHCMMLCRRALQLPTDGTEVTAGCM